MHSCGPDFQRSSANRSRHFNFIFTAMHLYRIIFGTPIVCQRYSFVHDKILFPFRAAAVVSAAAAIFVNSMLSTRSNGQLANIWRLFIANTPLQNSHKSLTNVIRPARRCYICSPLAPPPPFPWNMIRPLYDFTFWLPHFTEIKLNIIAHIHARIVSQNFKILFHT